MESRELDEPSEQRSSDANPLPTFVGVGSRLDWDSPLQNIAFSVELPFWLLMPASTLRVSVGDFTTDIVIENDGVEFQRGRQFTRTHQNTVFIGGNGAATKATAPLTALPDGGLFRGTRTLLYINTFAISDALDAFFDENGPRYQDGFRYFASLALGHLPIINKVINAYRMASVDPFAHEVTAWDVPVWFVCQPPRISSVCLNSHLVEDWYPTIGKGLRSEEVVPYHATSVAAVEQQLTKGELPGEIDMLDGWSLFHMGRFGDSIRSFVTAIEVLVEAEIRRMLAKLGLSDDVIETRVDSTRNNFDKRLLDYCELSRRRIPGPQLHYIPWLNGLRLAEELDRTRKLRHKIVHHGHRLDHTFRGPMMRAAETTSWLFDWLSNAGDFEERRTKNATFFFGLRTHAVPFDCSICDGRIIVNRPFSRAKACEELDEETVVIDSMSRVVHNNSTLLRAISIQRVDGKDVEHFVKMAFYELGAGELEDSPFEVSPHPTAERFRMHVEGKSVPVFVLDTCDPVSIEHVQEVNAFLHEKRDGGKAIDRAIVVANDQNNLEWNRRFTSLEASLEKLASDSGITVIRTSDLARHVLGAMKYNWSSATSIHQILRGGVFKASPPASQYCGQVYHFWSDAKVVGVQMTESVDVKVGDIVALQLPEGFHQVELTERKIDSDGRLTFKIDLERSDVPIASNVFLMDAQLSFEPKTVGDIDEFDGFGRTLAGGIVHPSRDN